MFNPRQVGHPLKRSYDPTQVMLEEKAITTQPVSVSNDAKAYMILLFYHTEQNHSKECMIFNFNQFFF